MLSLSFPPNRIKVARGVGVCRKNKNKGRDLDGIESGDLFVPLQKQSFRRDVAAASCLKRSLFVLSCFSLSLSSLECGPDGITTVVL
jgi:hypothetical protein